MFLLKELLPLLWTHHNGLFSHYNSKTVLQKFVTDPQVLSLHPTWPISHIFFHLLWYSPWTTSITLSLGYLFKYSSLLNDQLFLVFFAGLLIFQALRLYFCCCCCSCLDILEDFIQPNGCKFILYIIESFFKSLGLASSSNSQLICLFVYWISPLECLLAIS